MRISHNLKILVSTIGITIILATGMGCPFCITESPYLTKDEKIAALIISTVDAYREYLRERDPLPHKLPSLNVKPVDIKSDERSPSQGGSMTGKRGC